MKLYFYSLLLVFSVLLSCNQQNETLPKPIQPATLVEAIDHNALELSKQYDAYFLNEMKLQRGVGAAVALVKDGKIILTKGYGLRNAQHKDSVNTNTVFRIGSLSKGFTGVLAGILAQQHYLNLDDKVTKWLPDFKLKDRAQTNRVEIWHLLSHTTGLPYHAYTNLIEEGYDLDKIVNEYFPKSPVCGKEGVFYAYQNAAFSLTGTIMAKATGQSFSDLMYQRIFRPSNMALASCDYNSMVNNENKAVPHQWSGWNWVPGQVSEEYYNVAEAGGINASIGDMAKWLQVLLGTKPEIIQNEVLNTIFNPVVKTGKERRILGNWIDRDSASYALGWRVLERNSDTIIYHSGYVNGYRGEIAFDRKRNIGICVLFNGQVPLAGTCVPDFFEMAESLLPTK